MTAIPFRKMNGLGNEFIVFDGRARAVRLSDDEIRNIGQADGIGFDQKYSEQIFGMFKRLHLNTEFEGTGIGLALCKKIVEEHNGFITARSKINEGSLFIISLPVQQPVAEPVGKAELRS